jgi:hypothetical protein
LYPTSAIPLEEENGQVVDDATRLAIFLLEGLSQATNHPFEKCGFLVKVQPLSKAFAVLDEVVFALG